MNPFKDLSNNVHDATLNSIYTQTTGLGQDIYTLLMVVGTVMGVLSLLAFAGLKFLLQGNGATPRLKFERKEKFKWIIIAMFLLSIMVVLFGAVNKAANVSSFQNMGGW